MHAAAAAHPDGPPQALLDDIADRWPELGLPENWLGRRERARVEAMVTRFVAYADAVAADGWDVSTERPFSVAVGRAVLVGRADRLHVRDGEARIVDLKTSPNAVTKAEAQRNPQLAMYQVAADLGGFDGVTAAVGAELVYPGAGGDPVRVQDRLDITEGVSRLEAIVETLSHASFDAIPGDDCRTCPVRRSCPAWPEGGRVSDS